MTRAGTGNRAFLLRLGSFRSFVLKTSLTPKPLRAVAVGEFVMLSGLAA